MDVPILVVDDVPANPLAIQAVLTEPGVEFVSASGGETARMLKACETGAADDGLKPFEPVVRQVAVFRSRQASPANSHRSPAP